MSYPVSVEENTTVDMTIYPNPTSDHLNILMDGMKHISITNSLGQLVYDKDVDSDNEVINMSQFEAGVYMLHLTTDAGMATERVIVIK